MVPTTTSRQRGGTTQSVLVVPGARPKSKPDKVPCCRIWPNGEFGLSWSSREEEADRLTDNPAGGVSVGRMREEAREISEREDGSAPWLVKSAKSAQRPETYGRKGITSYGSKVVRSGAYLLQERYGRRRLSFLTLTLPPLEPDELQRVAESWGDCVKQLIQGLARVLQRQGLPRLIVAVTEIQEKRLQGAGLGYLHVHATFVGRHSRGAWCLSPEDVRRMWLAIVSRKVGRIVESESCEEIRVVRKSAENYLGKYMSKGGEALGEYAEKMGWKSVPRQWWTATQPVKNWVKKRSLNGELISNLLDEIVHEFWKNGGESNTNGIKFCRPITIKSTEYQSYVIAYFGKIDRETYRDLESLTRVVKSA